MPSELRPRRRRGPVPDPPPLDKRNFPPTAKQRRTIAGLAARHGFPPSQVSDVGTRAEASHEIRRLIFLAKCKTPGEYATASDIARLRAFDPRRRGLL
jgi:hypothetical protein